MSDGPVRVGAHKAEVGDAARAGGAVTEVTTTEQEVTASVDAGLAASVERGDAVTVTLPDGREARGAITRVGTVANAAGQDEDPTVELEARLRGRGAGRLDGAPVTLSIATDATKGVLAVPVTALVATGPSQYAIQLAGSRTLVPVKLGASADGWAEVSGDGLAAGTQVVVPR
jgi:hypothetical protein